MRHGSVVFVEHIYLIFISSIVSNSKKSVWFTFPNSWKIVSFWGVREFDTNKPPVYTTEENRRGNGKFWWKIIKNFKRIFCNADDAALLPCGFPFRISDHVQKSPMYSTTKSVLDVRDSITTQVVHAVSLPITRTKLNYHCLANLITWWLYWNSSLRWRFCCGTFYWHIRVVCVK